MPEAAVFSPPVVVALLTALLAPLAHAGPGPFDTAPQKLLKLVDDAPDDVASWVVSRHSDYQVLEDGRVTVVNHAIVVVRSAAGVDAWTSVGTSWAPELQERPDIRARVVTPDGEVHELDPSRFTEGAQRNDSPMLLQDTREIWAPLPRVTPGAVIEYTITQRDKSASKRSGRVFRLHLGNVGEHSVQTYRVRTPGHMPLHWEPLIEGLELDVKEKKSRKQRSWELTLEASVESDAPIRHMPHGRLPYPVVVVGTGAAWEEVSKDYAALIGEALSPAGLEEAVAQVRAAPDVAAKVAEATRIARDDVRYTGVEFGMNRLVPYAPGDVMRLGYGDCKDKASLIVTLLAEAGVEAQTALLWADDDPHDLEPEFPSLDWFNHVIVYVPELDLWVDPTSRFSAPGVLPLTDQGRYALPVSTEGNALRLTPRQTATYIDARRYAFAIPGQGAVSQRIEATGHRALALHEQYSTADPGSRRKLVDGHGSRQFGSPSTRAEFGPLTAGDFTMQVEASSRRSQSLVGKVKLQTNLSPVTGALPWLFHMEQGATNDPLPERTVDVEVPRLRAVAEDVVELPRHHVLEEAPTSQSWTVGDATLSMTHTRDDNVVTHRLELDTGDGRFSVDEVQQMREALATVSKTPTLLFRHPAARALDEGTEMAGWQALHDAVPDGRYLAQEWLIRGLLLWEAGFEEESVATLRKGVKQNPDDPFLLRQLGMSMALRDMPGGDNMLRRAWEADQDFAPVDLARYLFHLGAYEDILEIAEEYDELDLSRNAALDELIDGARLMTGDVDTVLESGSGYPRQVAQLLGGTPLDWADDATRRKIGILTTYVSSVRPDLLEDLVDEDGKILPMVEMLATAQELGTPTTALEAVAKLMGEALQTGKAEGATREVRAALLADRESLYREAGLGGMSIPSPRSVMGHFGAALMLRDGKVHGDEEHGFLVFLPTSSGGVSSSALVETRKDGFLVTAFDEGTTMTLAKRLDKALKKGPDEDSEQLAALLATALYGEVPDQVPDNIDYQWLLVRQSLGFSKSDHDRLASLDDDLVDVALWACGDDKTCALALLAPRDDDVNPVSRVRALYDLGDVEAARAFAARVDDRNTSIALATDDGDWDRLDELVGDDEELRKFSANNAIWGMLLAGDVELASEWGEYLEVGSTASLHTQACLQLMTGDLDGAIDSWEQVRSKDPDLPEWGLVEGRIAQAFGLDERAKRAFGRVEKSDRHDATWRLLTDKER